MNSIGWNCCSSRSRRWKLSGMCCLPRNKSQRQRRRRCCSIPEFAAILWSEGLFRHFDNRRQVASYAGLAPTPWQSGSVDREQGVSKAGNPRLRTTLIQLKMGGPGAPDDLSLAPVTQVWLAVSDDPAATVTGQYFYHQQRHRVHPAALRTDLQDELLSYCAGLTGVPFPRELRKDTGRRKAARRVGLLVSRNMKINGLMALVTGANRGLGRAFVQALRGRRLHQNLRRGAHDHQRAVDARNHRRAFGRRCTPRHDD